MASGRRGLVNLQAFNGRLQNTTYNTCIIVIEAVLCSINFGPWLWKGLAGFLDRRGLDNEILRSLFFLGVIILCKEIIVFILALHPEYGDKGVCIRSFWIRIKKGCLICVFGVLATAVTVYLRRVGIPYSDLYFYPFFVPVSTYKKFLRLFPNYVFNSPPPSLDTDQATTMDVHKIRYKYARRLVAPLVYLQIFNYITYTSDLYFAFGFKERAVAPGVYVFNFIFVYSEFLIIFAKNSTMMLRADGKANSCKRSIEFDTLILVH